MREQLLIERYKYVLEQKKRLNDATFKVAAFFQAALLVILGGQFRILELAQKREISRPLAELGSWGLFWAVVALSSVSLLLLIGGISSWFDYRKDEAEIELELSAVSRPPASMKGFFRWYETYIGLIIVSVALSYAYSMKWIISPALAGL